MNTNTSDLSKNPQYHWLIIAIVAIGVALRIVKQFVFPAFNMDELKLGNNIVARDALSLIRPLDFEQSSPPLFLLLEKLAVSMPSVPDWIGLKTVSFVSSVLSLLLFARLLKPFQLLTAAVALSLFALNPYFIYNSLTVKQYTIDLLGVLLLVNYFRNERFRKWMPLFFMVWSLMSNIGAFACAGYLAFRFIETGCLKRPDRWIAFGKAHWLIILSPLPYVLYFIWFMQQPGAIALKLFMDDFWRNSFIPLNGNIFRYSAYLLHSIWVTIFNGYEAIGILLLGICSYGALRIFRKKPILQKAEIGLLFSSLAIHIILNIAQVYPFSGRMFLYTGPFFLLLFAASLDEILKNTAYKKMIAAAILLTLTTTYFTYMFQKDNDLAMLYGKLDRHSPNNSVFYATRRTIESHELFHKLSEGRFLGRDITFHEPDAALDKSDILVSRIFRRLGPDDTRSPEEDELLGLLKEKRIELIEISDGFNIYRIRH